MALTSWVLFLEGARRCGEDVRQALACFSCCFDLVTVYDEESAVRTLGKVKRHPPALLIVSAPAYSELSLQALQALQTLCRSGNHPMLLVGTRSEFGEMAQVLGFSEEDCVFFRVIGEEGFVRSLEVRLGQLLRCPCTSR